MKISRLEFVTILLTAAVLAFSAGWFLRGGSSAGPIQVVTEHAAPAATAVVSQHPASMASTASVATAPTTEGKVNINTADSDTLQTLPGIGEKRAADIIAYRTEHGPFRIPEDLTQVKGIGEATLAGLIDYITTEGEY